MAREERRVANWRFVSPYDERYAHRKPVRGLSLPPIRPGNRRPALTDVGWAIARHPALRPGRLDPPPARPVTLEVEDRNGGERVLLIEWTESHAADDGTGGWFALRGDFTWEVILTATLCHRRGQLVFLPDDGSPSVVLDSDSDPERIVALWREAHDRADGWAWLHRRLYGGATLDRPTDHGQG
jgi:hypothetical protein